MASLLWPQNRQLHAWLCGCTCSGATVPLFSQHCRAQCCELRLDPVHVSDTRDFCQQPCVSGGIDAPCSMGSGSRRMRRRSPADAVPSAAPARLVATASPARPAARPRLPPPAGSTAPAGCGVLGIRAWQPEPATTHITDLQLATAWSPQPSQCAIMCMHCEAGECEQELAEVDVIQTMASAASAPCGRSSCGANADRCAGANLGGCSCACTRCGPCGALGLRAQGTSNLYDKFAIWCAHTCLLQSWRVTASQTIQPMPCPCSAQCPRGRRTNRGTCVSTSERKV